MRTRLCTSQRTSAAAAIAAHLTLAVLLACGVLVAQAHEFNINCNSNLVVYWGQNSHGVTSGGENQLPLDEYCDKDAGDVLVLSFLSEFNADGLHPPGLNLASSCLTTFENSTLLHCPNVGRAIAKCQKKGKAVLLSLGGATGAYGFSDDTQAERYADEIWNMFLGGNSQTRPFDDAVLDGIDLDIEGGSSVGYVRFVQRLRERFIESPGRRFYVTAAPQCFYPDFYSGPILDNAYLDMVFVQFYNNYCGVDKPNWFNFEQWHEWATTISANKNVRVYLGVPGSAAAASMGYVPVDKLEELVNVTRKKFSSFGGMMVWDASQADTNRVADDASFVDLSRRLLDSGRQCSDGSLESASDPSSSEQTSGTLSSTATTSKAHSESSSSTSHESKSETESNDSKSSRSSSSFSSTDDQQHQQQHSSTEGDRDSSSSEHRGTTTRQRTSTVVGPSGTATIVTHFEVSQIATDSADTPGLAQQRLNRVAAATLDSDESTDSTTASEEGDSTTPSDEADEQSANDLSAADATSSEDSTAESEADPADGESAEERKEDESESTSDGGAEAVPENSNETTTMETTKVVYTTTTRTRKVHIVTKHTTTRVRKPEQQQGSGLLTEPSPTTTTNKTISIVTPTFPLPIARCPRADQPCIGAGFACNGYEFGQCVNNRWLMRPCSTDRVTACFNAGPDLVACDFPKGRSLQVCDDILAPLPYGRLASNVLFLRASDQERALNTPVYPVPSSTATTTTHVKKHKDDDDDDDDTDDDDDDYIYNKYGEKKKNTATSTTTDMELVKQSSGVNLIDDHNRREDPAMLMVKDPEAYYGPDGHVRVVGGNVVDDLRKHNSFGTSREPYDENPPVDDPEEADEYSDGDEFMRKRDLGAWDEEPSASAASSVPSVPTVTPVPPLALAPASPLASPLELPTCRLARRDNKDLVGESVSMAHLNEKPWRAQVEDFYAIYAMYAAFSGISNDLLHQQFERIILDHIDGDFLIPPRLPALAGHPMLARFTFVPVRGDDPNYMHHRTKDGMVEETVLVVVRTLTNTPIPKRWRVALPLPLNATMLHTSRGSFYAGDRVSAEIKSLYSQRVAFYNDNIRLNTNKRQSGPESQRLNDLAAGHSSSGSDSGSAVDQFADGDAYDSVKRSLISPAVITQILHKKPSKPLPLELLDEPVPNDPAGRLYEVRSDPDFEKGENMALYFTIRVKTHAMPGAHVTGALPHPLLSFITTN
ncbi:Chitinase 2 [Coemansia sp. RSA 1200]|nr:Chitinase 2 [Coemansia sp. RSA 1200]